MRNLESGAARLFEQHSERVFGYCLRFLGSRSDAEDAVQTTFLHAHRALEQGVVPELEYPWLHSIATNVCRGQLRTLARRGPLASELDLDTLPAPANREHELRELRSELAHALASLPETQRRALVLREWQGLESHEVASELGLSTTAAYALLTRARQSLARALSAAGTRPVLGVDFVSALAKLKALLAGGAAKVAVTTVAVGTVAIGGVAVERAVVHRDAPSKPGTPIATLEAGADGTAVTSHDVDAATTRPTTDQRRTGTPTVAEATPTAGSSSGAHAGPGPAGPAAPTPAPAGGGPGTTGDGGEASAPSSQPAASRPQAAVPVEQPALVIPLVDDLVEDVVDPLLEDPLAVVPPVDVELPLDEVAPPLSDVEEDVENALEDPLPAVKLPVPKLPRP